MQCNTSVHDCVAKHARILDRAALLNALIREGGRKGWRGVKRGEDERERERERETERERER